MTRSSTSSSNMMERYFLSDAVHSTAAAAAYGPKDMLPHLDEWGWFVSTDTAAISSD